ncbi:MAG: M16 family metallopeptidase [bacterium]
METPRFDQLENGLRVLLLESHSAPVVTFWVWYAVGSRNETPGLTGVSHWVEHMLFKGTPDHPKGMLTRAVERLGGRWNAFTSKDYTAFHEVLPAGHLPFVIGMEADRMRHTIFDPAEVESERTVVIAEREGLENSPAASLYEEVEALAFKVHPYRQPVIGWKADLRAMTRDDLYAHYQAHYHPRSALIVAVGAFAAAEVLEQITRAFGALPPGPAVAPVRVVEPPQAGERRVLLQRSGGATPYVQMAFPAQAAVDPDLPAILVLDGVLSGFGRGRDGGAARSSRLYRALVDAGLALDAGSAVYATRDPGLLRVAATARSGVTAERVEHALLEVIEAVTREEVGPEELARVKRQARAQFVYARDGVHGYAGSIGAYAMVDQPDAFFALPERIEAVTAAEVQRAAAALFDPQRRTVGWYVPDEDAPAPRAPTATSAAVHPRVAFFTGSRPSAGSGEATAPSVLRSEQIHRTVLPNGLRLLAVDRPGSGMVALQALIAAGGRYDDGRPGLARFVAAALQRGTTTTSAQALAERLDGMGAGLAALPGLEAVTLAGRALAEDFPAYLRLAGEVLTAPAFPPDELAKVRGELLTGLRVHELDTRYAAERAFRRLAFPLGDPQAQPPDGAAAVIEAVERGALASFHERRYRPEETILVLVGDLPPEAARAEVETILGGWPRAGHDGRSGGASPAPEAPAAAAAGGPRREFVPVPGKTQADIVLGGIAVSRSDPGYYALMLATLILGRQGMMGRVGQRVREDMGLAYYAYVEARAGLLAGPWWARAGVNPAHVDRAVEAIVDEAVRFGREGPTTSELEDGRDYLTGSLAVRLETQAGLAAALAEIEFFGLGLDYLQRYPAIIGGVSAEAIQAAARRFPVEGYALAVAGPPPS